jgi:hypothetical protein
MRCFLVRAGEGIVGKSVIVLGKGRKTTQRRHEEPGSEPSHVLILLKRAMGFVQYRVWDNLQEGSQTRLDGEYSKTSSPAGVYIEQFEGFFLSDVRNGGSGPV